MSLLLLANCRTLAAQSQGLLAQVQERAVQYQALAAQAQERAAIAQQATDQAARETAQQERLLVQATERVRVAEQRLLLVVKAVKALTVVRVVKEIERDQMVSELPDACGICLEKHRKSNSCSLNCKHDFGIQCFNGWKKVSKKKLNCPMCRDTVTVITSYKKKKS